MTPTTQNVLIELIDHPEKAAALPVTQIPALMGMIASVQNTLLARLMAEQGNAVPQGDDRLLAIDEAAARLGITKDWLYRRADKLPFTVRMGSRLRFSSNGIDKFIAQRRGRQG